jgi:hypothetical protein
VESWEKSCRYLTAEEFDYPYFAFEKFARRRGWEEVLQELMEFALMNSTIEGVYKMEKLMMWRERMMAVVEEGWMIEKGDF